MTNSFKYKCSFKPSSVNLITDIPNYPMHWLRIVEYYGQKGKPEFTFIKTIYGKDQQIESITFRNRSGCLLGIIEYFTTDGIPLEKKGSVNILVHPLYFRQGIGQSLLREALKYWPVKFENQIYTESGFALVSKFLGI